MSYSSTTAHSDHAHGSAAEHFDAHGHKDHGHVIVNVWMLRGVLAILLFFTFATVGAAVAEQWVSDTFNVIIPQWMNVAVALSIAVIKTTLVVLIFMQLKYDNPLNSMIFVFTILTVAFFLGFTALDLGGRRSIDTVKGRFIYDGGKLTAGGTVPAPADPKLAARAQRDKEDKTAEPFIYVNVTTDESIVGRARRLAAERKRLGLTADKKGSYGHGHDDHGLRGSITDAGYRRFIPAAGSSEELSRPVHGLTLPGFDDPAAKPAAPDPHADH